MSGLLRPLPGSCKVQRGNDPKAWRAITGNINEVFLTDSSFARRGCSAGNGSAGRRHGSQQCSQQWQKGCKRRSQALHGVWQRRGSGTSWNMRGSGQPRNAARAQGGWTILALGGFTPQTGEALRSSVWPQSWAYSGQWLWLDTSPDNHPASLNCPVMLSSVLNIWIHEL